MGKRVGQVTHWAIKWNTPDSDAPKLNLVALCEGDTSWNDIPQIIAIKRGLSRDSIIVEQITRIDA